MKAASRTGILRMVQTRLLAKLDKKTNWGRNELGEMIQRTIQEVAFDIMDEEDKREA